MSNVTRSDPAWLRRTRHRRSGAGAAPGGAAGNL